MVRTASLIVIMFLLSSCGPDLQTRYSDAKRVEALARAEDPLPDMPAACVAEMGRAYPSRTEKWVITQRRWETLAENRDQEAVDCGQWWDDYRRRRSEGLP